MSDLLDRMAEALRREHEQNKKALASLLDEVFYRGVNEQVMQQIGEVEALLAEYDRVKARTIALTFEKVREGVKSKATHAP